MANEVSNVRGGAVGMAMDLSALRAGLQNVRGTMKDPGATPFLRLQKDGGWVFGSDDADLGAKDEAIINPMSIKHGYSCWTNRKPGEGKNELLGEVMVSMQTPKPGAHELPQKVDDKTGDTCEWREQNALDLRMTTGKHKGTQLVYKTTAVGGVRAVASIIDAVIERLIDGEDEYLCPVITVGSDSYKHSTYGKVYTPKFEIVGWANNNGVEEGADQPQLELDVVIEEPVADEVEEPARRRRRA